MKKLFNSKLLMQVVVASMVATLATALIVSAATTIGSDIATAGDVSMATASSTGIVKFAQIQSTTGTINFDNENLTTTGTLASGALTVTGALSVSAATTLATASSTGTVKFAVINSDTGAISFGDENLSTTGTLASGALTVTGNLSTSAVFNFDSASSTAGGTATLKVPTINSDTGAISFGDENLSTTGTLASGALTVTGALSVSAATTLATASSTGTVKFAVINSDTGAISFGDENLTTTGTLASGALTVTGAISATGSISSTGALSVNGNATTTAQGIVTTASTSTAPTAYCGTTTAGGLLWYTTSSLLCVCNGTSWIIASSTSGAACQ